MVKPRIFAPINREIYEEILEICTEEIDKAKGADRVIKKKATQLKCFCEKELRIIKRMNNSRDFIQDS